MKASTVLALCALLGVLSSVCAQEAELLYSGYKHGSKYGGDHYDYHPKGDYYKGDSYKGSYKVDYHPYKPEYKGYDKYDKYDKPEYKDSYKGGYTGDYHKPEYKADSYKPKGYSGPEGHYEQPKDYGYHEEEWSCDPGKGGPHCETCPPGTYSTGGAKCKCTPCGGDKTSAKGSTSKAACIPAACGRRGGFYGLALPADGSPVVRSDIPVDGCPVIPDAEEGDCIDDTTPGNYYVIEPASKNRTVIVHQCAMARDTFVDYYSVDLAITAYDLNDPTTCTLALTEDDTGDEVCNDDWTGNSGDVYDAAELICDNNNYLAYLQLTLVADTTYVIFSSSHDSFSSECADGYAPNMVWPLITTFKVIEVDGVPVGEAPRVPARKVPAKKAPMSKADRLKLKKERKECRKKTAPAAKA